MAQTWMLGGLSKWANYGNNGGGVTGLNIAAIWGYLVDLLSSK